MSKLIYKRRTKGTDSTMASVFSKEEIFLYFESEEQWQRASKIYWQRAFSGIRSSQQYLDKYKISLDEFYDLIDRYARYLHHRYERVK